jgi:hypothetical protein
MSDDKSGDLGAQGVNAHAQSNFWESAYSEALWRLNDNGVLPHPVGTINGQEIPSSAGAITSAPACTSCQ